MRLMGFNFTKINIEKSEDSGENLKINTHIDIFSIDKADIDFFKGKEELVAVKFKYDIDYDPKFAKIRFEGNMLISLDLKQIKDLLKKWKNKEIPEDIKFSIFSIIIRKVSVKALQLEDELNLPFHIPMPRLSRENLKDNK